MNKNRRDRLAKLSDQISDIMEKLEELRDEELEAFENLPESLNSSETRGNDANSNRRYDDALSSLENADSRILDAMDSTPRLSMKRPRTIKDSGLEQKNVA